MLPAFGRPVRKTYLDESEGNGREVVGHVGVRSTNSSLNNGGGNVNTIGAVGANPIERVGQEEVLVHRLNEKSGRDRGVADMNCASGRLWECLF